ncbi:sugar kinase [Microbacterium sp. NPDC096154]|uniref:sugar kinase n=1 Tax=Microbacterium sp. NPDC096154 TaxID=3155549 RepID=UPI003322D6EA
MTDVVTFGEALIAIRTHGRLGLGDPLSASPAGAEMNVAIGLARLGHDVRWIGALGKDPAGDLVQRTLRAEAVDVSRVRLDADAPTGLMLVDMPPALPPVVTYHRRGSAGSRIAPADVSDAGGTARVWHLTGVTPALSSSALAATQAGIDEARRAGALVSFDVNYRAKLWDRGVASAALAPLARQADVIIASEDELDLVADGRDEAARLADLLDGGSREVIVKRGRSGADHYDGEAVTSCPAYPVDEVNSIGAGDAFTAGYLSGLLDGLETAERLRRGALCGALAVAGVGDWEQAPTRAELDRLGATSDAVR